MRSKLKGIILFSVIVPFTPPAWKHILSTNVFFFFLESCRRKRGIYPQDVAVLHGRDQVQAGLPSESTLAV
jgi:hypothetical protein